VVIFDRYPLVLRAMETHLRAAGLKVVARAPAPERALALVLEHEPDLFVAGISTPTGSMDGVELLRQAHEVSPSVKVIGFADGPDDNRVEEALAAGASAFLSKEARAVDVAFAVRQTYEPSIHLARVRDDQQSPEVELLLTDREAEVLGLVAEGYSNLELAAMLEIAHQTVKFHLSNIYRKLDVENRTQAARRAQLLNLSPREPHVTRTGIGERSASGASVGP
jgi:DNA-binding NarL/FixJ family response regulator